jgi:hypothetical protein
MSSAKSIRKDAWPGSATTTQEQSEHESWQANTAVKKDRQVMGVKTKRPGFTKALKENLFVI